MEQKTGILLFARSPEEEAKTKRWTKSARKNALLAQKLYEHTFDVLHSTALPIHHVDSKDQKGADFGSKISNAIEDFFKLGYSKAIVIGSDCVSLQIKDLEIASKNLEEGKHTIGGSLDGGVYLFTLDREHFNKSELRDLPWCSASLRERLLTFETYREGDLAFLQERLDLDPDTKLETIVLADRASVLRNLILSILSFRLSFIGHSFIEKLVLLSSLKERGPPVLVY